MVPRALIVSACLMGVGSAALADVAPYTVPAGHTLIPFSRQRWIEGKTGVPVDIALQREELTLELYPTLMRVHAVFYLRGGAKRQSLVIGFPAYLSPIYDLGQKEPPPSSQPASRPTSRPSSGSTSRPTSGPTSRPTGLSAGDLPALWRHRGPSFGHLQLPPLDGLTILVNDEAYRPRHTRPMDPSTSKLLGEWWVFTATVPARERIRVTVSYAQRLVAHPNLSRLEEVKRRCRTPHAGCSALLASYYLLTGRLWKGPIGEAKILLRLHGVDRRDLEVHPAPHDGEGRELRWEYRRWVPESDMRIAVHLPLEAVARQRTIDRPPYARDLPPRLALLDRLYRFDGLTGDPGPEHWERLVTSLQQQRRSRDCDVALLATEVLDELHRRSRRACDGAGDEAEVERLLRWISEGRRGGCSLCEPGRGPAAEDDWDRLVVEGLFHSGGCFLGSHAALLGVSRGRRRWRLAGWIAAGVLPVLVLVLVLWRRHARRTRRTRRTRQDR